VTSLGLMTGILGVQAQTVEPDPWMIFFLAPDPNGVQQIFQGSVGLHTTTNHQLTHVAEDITAFGTSYDRRSVAYISGGQVWLRQLQHEEAEVLASVETPQFYGTLVFSQDGQYLAYADTGIWLIDLATRKTRQILTNVPLAKDINNAGQLRLYAPKTFVQNEDGTITKLIVDVGMWEWITSGVYDLTTDIFVELVRYSHTNILALSDGRALLYGNGNSGLGGEPTIELATSLDALDSTTTVLELNSLRKTMNDTPLFAEHAVEIAPGLVRVSGSGMQFDIVVRSMLFYFDLDLATGTTTEVYLLPLDDNGVGRNFPILLSPDGRFMSIYNNLQWRGYQAIYDGVSLYDLETGETVETILPEIVFGFEWAK
jgi:hypothetical protein